MVALAEVAGGHDGEGGDEGEGQGEAGGGGEVGADAAEEVEADGGNAELHGEEEELAEGGVWQVGEAGEGFGHHGEPDDERGIGFEDLRAVEGGALEVEAGGVKEPHLVVSGGGEQGEECGHAAGGEGEDEEGVFGGARGLGLWSSQVVGYTLVDEARLRHGQTGR